MIEDNGDNHYNNAKQLIDIVAGSLKMACLG